MKLVAPIEQTPREGADAAQATELVEPYFLGLDRAMVSLGPLSGRRYCTFNCKFCYVHGPYQKYASKSPEEIIEWLAINRLRYNIVYVSGDTDSFAAPRTSDGLALLESLLALRVDVLFTTRHAFRDSNERTTLARLIARFRRENLLFVPCVSISQLNHPAIEPRPVPSPAERFELLRWLNSEGADSILTIRPFIPYIGASEYAEIAQEGAGYSKAILGGDWYTDPQGLIDSQTREALGIPPTKDLAEYGGRRSALDSSFGTDEWIITAHPEAEAAVGHVAQMSGVPFFTRSGPSIEMLRKRYGG